MPAFVQNIFLTKKETLSCSICGNIIPKGKAYVAESEQHKGTCYPCSPFTACVLLPSGDAAMTRRSKKHSSLCGVVQQWNVRRKRFERIGQLVQPQAIEKAKLECQQDATERLEKNKKAAQKRAIEDKAYIEVFAQAIRHYYPNCPTQREYDIAKHACEKYSGRVGRTSKAKQFDRTMIDLAVEAHIRHTETNYDNEFGKGKRKKEIRSEVKEHIVAIMKQWKRK